MRHAATPEIHVVTPDLFTHPGGIARITRALCAAIAQYAARRGLRMVVHALRDRGGDRDHRYVPVGHAFRGYDGSRSAFVASISGLARAPVHGVVVAHVNFMPAVCMLARRACPLVVVAHGIDVWDPLPVHRRLALVSADRVWAVSRFTARVVRGVHGVPHERVVAIPNCLDPVWSMLEPPSSPLPPNVEPPYFLVVSRLDVDVEGKGVAHALEAFLRARESQALRGWRLVVAGDGERRNALEQTARRSGGENVVFTGRVDDETLRALYARCEAFVLPSAKEGFGLVFLEAMHFGKPVIAACAGAAPEVVADERTGLLVPFGDVPAIEAAMKRLARSGELRRALGTAGRELAASTFSYARYEQRVWDELERLGV